MGCASSSIRSTSRGTSRGSDRLVWMASSRISRSGSDERAGGTAMTDKQRWLVVVLYGAAMAYVEAAVVLFLLALPWWGPVLAPVGIGVLMVLGGTLVSRFDRRERALWPGPWAWGANLVGVALALYVFMADAIGAAGGGAEAVAQVLPTQFNWPVFVVAWLLLAVPIVDLCRQQWNRRLTPEPESDKLDSSK